MYSSLRDAPVNTELTVLGVSRPDLAFWLQGMGIFVGSTVLRHDSEINYHPVRIRGRRGDMVVPAGLGIKVFVHTDEGEKVPLVEMKKKQTGHVESMTCGRGCIAALKHLGLEEGADITFVRALPHMDYVTVLDRQRRTRLSEGEAARIWGRGEDGEATQFYFARKNTRFQVAEIIGGKKITQHLKTHGVEPGKTLVLKAIEQVQELYEHKPCSEHITISSPGGLRLYLSLQKAAEITVRSVASEQESDEQPSTSGLRVL